MKIVAAIAALAALLSCGYETSGKAKDPGIYVCHGPQGKPTYRLHTEAETTLYWKGDGGGLSFVDIDSGRPVRLRSVDGYRCIKDVRAVPVGELRSGGT